jgi:hypothetical protein
VEKRKILIQVDTDPQASVFDRVVAIDAGAEEVLSYAPVKVDEVRELVHGAIFTRGPKDLKNTAVFIGGSNVAAGERLLEESRRHMLPQYGLQVSVMLDASGANTTAAAAVMAAAGHLELKGCKALVLAATGPVGQRVVRLLARAGAQVRVASRQLAKAQELCHALGAKLPGASLDPTSTASAEEMKKALTDQSVVIAAGAAGVLLLPRSARQGLEKLRVAIDLNAVPPLGIEGIDSTDKAVQRDGVFCYGAIGIGGTKMKLHKLAIARLFESNDQFMDAEEIYALAANLKP